MPETLGRKIELSRLIHTGEPLFAAAQDGGEVRDDVTMGRVLDDIVSISRVPPDPASTISVVDVLLGGLRRCCA